jgi:hypothetical protein
MRGLKRSTNCVWIEHAAAVWSQGMQPLLRTVHCAGERTGDLGRDWRQHLGELSDVWIIQAVEWATKAFRLASVTALHYHHYMVQSVISMPVWNPSSVTISITGAAVTASIMPSGID